MCVRAIEWSYKESQPMVFDVRQCWTKLDMVFVCRHCDLRTLGFGRLVGVCFATLSLH